MKIAVVTERIEAWRGGAETSTLELSRLLAAAGHEVHLVTSSRCPSPPDLTIHTVSATTVLRPLRTAAFVKKATAFLRRQSFDIVHAVMPLPCADVFQPRGGLLRETMDRNVAIRRTTARQLLKRTAAMLNVKQRSLLDLERAVFRDGGPTIVAISQYVARQCAEQYGVTPPRVRVVFNGVQAKPDSPEQVAADRKAIHEQYRIPADDLILAFVAHNFKLKGLGPVLEACGRLVGSGFRSFRLLVVGRDNPAPFQRQIDAAGLGKQVIFTGPTQRSGVFLNAADVLVHPTFYDPCSRVVLEALAHGVPCMTTVYNGAAEVMQDGREGYILSSPLAVDEMAERIRWLAPVEVRRRMSDNALQLRERISMGRHVRELIAVFEDIVAQRRRTQTA